jgi:hypothetical protein
LEGGEVTAPVRFTQADVRRALKAAKEAGYSAPRVILRPNGEIEIIGSNQAPANDDEEDFDL